MAVAMTELDVSRSIGGIGTSEITVSSARSGTLEGCELALGLSIGTADDDGGADALLDAEALEGARDCVTSSMKAVKELALLTLRKVLISPTSTI